MDWGFIGLVAAGSAAASDMVRWSYSRYSSSRDDEEDEIQKLKTDQQEIRQFLFGIEGAESDGHAIRTESEMRSLTEQLESISDRVDRLANEIQKEGRDREKEHEKVYGKIDEMDSKLDKHSSSIEELK